MGGPIDWNSYGGGGSSSGGTTSKSSSIRLVDTFDTLKKVVPDYDERSLLEVLMILTKNQVRMDPDFYKELERSLMDIERETGISVAEIASARNVGSTIQKVVQGGIDSIRDGSSGRTQFASEAALDVAQAKRLGDQTVIEKAQLEADKVADLRREMNDLRQTRISERIRAREGGVEMAGVDQIGRAPCRERG